MTGVQFPGVQIGPAGPDDMDLVRAIFREYAGWLQVDYCLQDFEAELAGLPGDYAPPGGGLWLAWVDGEPAGCVGYRPLAPQICEMKRLWVREGYRGRRLGRRLAETALHAARAAGYKQMSLETLGFMAEARRLYASLGFAETSRTGNPEDDVRLLERDLTAPVTA
ncbi:GNAT family N-acetyltransferase [Pelagibius litoralis]|uniref:GNAT family N-acetyltransferase n=1 Tax=Pelagibius litoralis TaxID=374515 RepID=A0A967EZX8_9PROT|nr:GNAT family N-acetyltransferase [Pelagibius litoralis]NIA70478.1 GNAT family N-acetyltransferase [Pelagibius litoralis]